MNGLKMKKFSINVIPKRKKLSYVSKKIRKLTPNDDVIKKKSITLIILWSRDFMMHAMQCFLILG